jgi:hypothetical protein
MKFTKERDNRMLTFDNDEEGYLQWVNTNPNGFVVNAPKQYGIAPDMLHKANCRHIMTSERTNYTTTDYKKLCSSDKKEIIDWGAAHSSNFKACKHCKP